MIKQIIINAIKKAIGESLGVLPMVEVEIPKDEAFGDAATTVAMALAPVLKKPPRRIAEELLPKIHAAGGPFERIEVAGPGFINFTFKQDYWYRSLGEILSNTEDVLRTDIGKGKKVQVEFVSANPTGPLHIGHGRGAAVGIALSNLLERAGYKVQKEYYINDAGRQVRLFGLSLYAKYQQRLGNEIPFPEDGYKGGYIDELCDEFIDRFGNKYLDVPSTECVDFFSEWAYQRMLREIEKDLGDFGVVFDRWQSEKAIYSMGKVDDAIAELKERGFIYEKEGALWFRSTAFGDDKDRVVRKTDGEYTYFASDIAYHREKLERGFDSIINIWGADHHGYVQRLEAVIEAFGFPRKRMKVVLVQMVSLLRHGQPVQMSKRAGEFITLREVMDEVGTDTSKFIFLTRRADSHLDFDIEVAKERSSENPVYYVQYAHARISSIFEQAEQRGINTSNLAEPQLSLLSLPDEIRIIKKLCHYPMVFELSASSLEPHRITYYLQELSGLFHPYYNRHRVISEDINLTVARLFLCKALHTVLKEGLGVLGVHAPQKM